MLAGLMKAPTKLAPNRNPAGAPARAAEVITAMAEEGYITPGDGESRPRPSGPGRARRARVPPITPPITSWTNSTTRSAPSTRTSSSRRRSAPRCRPTRNRR